MEARARWSTMHSCLCRCAVLTVWSIVGLFRITMFSLHPNVYPRRNTKSAWKTGDLSGVSGVVCEGSSPRGALLSRRRGRSGGGGERCFPVTSLRLREAAELAREMGMHLFNDHAVDQSAQKCGKTQRDRREAGRRVRRPLSRSDFKKKNGYKRSVELSEMYRQSVPAGVFSKRQLHAHGRRATGAEEQEE